MFQIQQGIESTSVSDTNTVCTVTAEKEYKKAAILRKIFIFFVLIFVTGAEGVLAGGMYYLIQKNDLQRRVIREYEIRHWGEVRLQT